jgi:ribonuclease VapC
VILARSGPKAQEKLDRLLNDLEIEVVSFARDQATLAATAYRQYGKGSGHAAGLNFGDCFSYALAKLRNEPLLFKGDDFSRTDLKVAVAR